MKTFNTKKVDWMKQPMFFGEEPNVQRFDQQKYPIFEKLNQQQLGFFWRPEEVSLQKDRNDYQSLGEEQKHIFTSNLKYQTLLDSVQGRGPCLAFLPYCSLPELESMLVAWDFSETIHSRSYTYITIMSYKNTSKKKYSRLPEVVISLKGFYKCLKNYLLTAQGRAKRKLRYCQKVVSTISNSSLLPRRT